MDSRSWSYMRERCSDGGYVARNLSVFVMVGLVRTAVTCQRANGMVTVVAAGR
jgi:hypothetical protein